MRSNVRIIKKDEEEMFNLEYWLRRTPEERLEAVQLLREQYIRCFNKQALYRESRKRLRRVFKITQQA